MFNKFKFMRINKTFVLGKWQMEDRIQAIGYPGNQMIKVNLNKLLALRNKEFKFLKYNFFKK